MPTNIFVNLPVRDLKRSMDFFGKLGYSFNPQFTDETAACMIISENIYAMLLTHAKFSEFTKKEIADANKTTEVLVALSFDSRKSINETMQKALDNGGKETREPQDYGFMYGRSYEDLDGHIWELIWMDMEAFPKKPVTS
jgi:predicted lactoylglutathione lyase